MNAGQVVAPSLVGFGLCFIMVLFLQKRLDGYDKGNEVMQKLSKVIADGARQFLVTEYKYLAAFVTIVAIILIILFSTSDKRVDDNDGIRVAGCFIVGAILSAWAGWQGMAVATDANAKTTHAADKEGLNAALQVAFSAGAVMGFTTVGFGLFGVAVMLLLMMQGRGDATDAMSYGYAAKNLAGFGFGASAIALFARVAGGIYTKAADVGADLVGKVEAGIPEDDPRNPAVIADNVGDNVGDVAGMGADLFESFVGSIIATVTLAGGDIRKIALPFWIAGVGVLSCFIGFWFVKTEDNASQKELLHALHKAIYVSGFLVVGLSALVCSLLFDNENEGWNYYGCILIGLLCGIVIGEMTEYCTSYSYFPVKSITDAGRTGPATVIIQGLGVGMISCVGPMVTIVVSILACNALGGAGNNGHAGNANGQYGIAIAAVGMLSTLCVTLATDAYGPVADNAGGIAEMAECDEKVRDTTDALDALGNTTAATGKGFAIGSAVLTSVALLAAYYVEAGITDLNLGDPIVFSGILFGSMLPYLFAALTMLSVRKAAASIIEEVRRQFAQIHGLMEGTAEPESAKCVAICTACSVEEMVLPGTYAVLSPILIGFLVGPKCLAGMLGGAIASGAMLGIMMSNAGGAWDNSKKYIEIEKACGGKGTDTHKACVIGDTVGDPFKDTSGPALNILIKLMSIIALTIAPLIAGNDSWSASEYGIIPLVLMIVVTIYQWYYYKDVEYKDSYAKVEGGETELTNKV
jgi:H(+)-translocating pyrophosphatase